MDIFRQKLHTILHTLFLLFSIQSHPGYHGPLKPKGSGFDSLTTHKRKLNKNNTKALLFEEPLLFGYSQIYPSLDRK